MFFPSKKQNNKTPIKIMLKKDIFLGYTIFKEDN